MPNATITDIPASPCGHRSIVTDQGTFTLHTSEIANAIPGTLAELRDSAIIVLRHQYLTRRAAGRTAAQAMNDLVGFTVRI